MPAVPPLPPINLPPKDVVAARDAALEASPELRALVLDVLSRQAEGKLLFAGKEHVASKARKHGVLTAKTDAGQPRNAELTETAEPRVAGEDVLGLLERGPETARQHAIIMALAVAGLRPHLTDSSRLEQFARHADWLELSTSYRPYALIDDVLGDDAAAVWEAVGRVTTVGADPSSAAWTALRCVALARSAHPAAARALVELAKTSPVAAAFADDQGDQGDQGDRGKSRSGSSVPSTWAKAKAKGRAPSPLRGDGHDTERDSSRGLDAPMDPTEGVSGQIASVPPSGFRGALRLVSGWALLQWAARLFMYALGVRRPAELRFVEGGLRLHKRVSLLGRTIREGQETYALSAVASVGRTSRWPALPLIVGALAFGLGVVIGGLWLFEGIRSGETVLLLAGAAAILIGGGLDLIFSLVLPARRRNVAIDLAVLPKRRVQLVAVGEAEAESFVNALRERFAHR